jgi:LAO/AO transport system kinase
MTARHTPARDIAALARGIRAGERATLARAITLIESRRGEDRRAAHRLVQEILPQTGGAIRVSITGVPGVGKSTTIDSLGTMLTQEGNKVAVLAVDPSSRRTGGSILADKTRMARLAADPNAFIRPSPAAGTLGGVAANTQETMRLCEAAGYDVILIETVGVGQSETAVADMTDFFLVLVLPGAGDEIQGLKKGVIELADMVAVNKADGDNIQRAAAAAAEYRSALHILAPRSPAWSPPVVTYSAPRAGASSRCDGCGPCSTSAYRRSCARIRSSGASCRNSKPRSLPTARHRCSRSRKSQPRSDCEASVAQCSTFPNRPLRQWISPRSRGPPRGFVS